MSHHHHNNSGLLWALFFMGMEEKRTKKRLEALERQVAGEDDPTNVVKMVAPAKAKTPSEPFFGEGVWWGIAAVMILVAVFFGVR